MRCIRLSFVFGELSGTPGTGRDGTRLIDIAAEIVTGGGRGGQSAVEIVRLVHVAQQWIVDDPGDKMVKVDVLVRYVQEVQWVLSTVIIDAPPHQKPEIIDPTVDVGDVRGGRLCEVELL